MRPDATVLAFDTSAAHCAAALLSGNRILAEVTEDMARGQAERLMPLLLETLAQGGCGWEDLDALAVGIGPGNFTGIRISVAAARGVALGLDIPAIGVSTFEALAWGHAGPTLVSLDARRDRIFVQAPGRKPEMATWPFAPLLPPDTLCLGFRAAEIAQATGARAGDTMQTPSASSIARAARPRLGQTAPAPAPLYLRPADAAPPTEAPPVMLHDA